MHSKKFRRRVLPIAMAAIMVASCFPAMAATPTTTTDDSWKTDWITFNEAGDTITDIDWDGYLYYVAAGEVLKNAPAFTNQGTIEEGRNENNLFGQPDEQYGFNSELVWDLEKGGAEGTLHKEYKTWEKYWEENGALITQQATMTDSIAFLADKAGASDVADYWMVRHGTSDRDTGFMNQTLLKLAMDKAEKSGDISVADFKFVFNRKHEGSYDIADAIKFMNDNLGASTTEVAEEVALAGTDATAELKITFGDKEVAVKRYTNTYVGEAAGSYLTAAQLENAKVNIYVPSNAKADTPVLYLVDNSGWFNNSYTDKLVEDGKAYNTADGKSNLAAYALSEGYIVVDAGLRARQYIDKGPKSSVDAKGNFLHSPVTVADAKAVITYVKSVLGENTEVVVSGTSGGGALSVVLGASGNSELYNAELEKLGAVAGDNSVAGLIAYCPITDLGHSDGSYEYTYAGTRADLLAAGYTKDSSGFVLSDSTMAVSPKLALEYTTYVNGLGVAGTDNTFDTATLTASGTLAKEAKALVIAALNAGLDDYENNKTAFLAVVSERAVAEGYAVPAPVVDDGKDSPKTGDVTTLPLFAVVIAVGAVALASTRKRVVR